MAQNTVYLGKCSVGTKKGLCPVVEWCVLSVSDSVG